MHLVETVKKDQIRNNQLVTMFVTPPSDKIEECDRLEVWGTDFNEGDSDYCDYRLMNGDEIIWNKKVDGY